MSLAGVKISIIGYGNQGCAQAHNLRDSALTPIVGCRPGGALAKQAKDEGFEVVTPTEAAQYSDLILLLLPDEIIGSVHAQLSPSLKNQVVGLAHGYAMHFSLIETLPQVRYVLVAPRGPGALLRERYLQKKKIPGVYAAPESDRALCLSYLEAIGADRPAIETSFREETLCDLFGEQAVLCGGLMALMESSLELLVKKGLKPEMAFIETCFEVKTIIELFLKYGPREMANRISPTAFFGGTTRGQRLREKIEPLLEKMYSELEDGDFAKECASEVSGGNPLSKAEKDRISQSLLQRTFDSLKEELPT